MTPPLEEGRVKVNDFRRQAVADQRRAASIYRMHRDAAIASGVDPLALDDRKSPHALPGRGVTMCGMTQIRDQMTEQWRVKRKDDRFHSYLTGLHRCGLRNVCPLCTAAKAEQDRSSINDGLSAARQRGLFPVMITLTARHSRRDDPQSLFAAIRAAEQGLKDKKAWKRLKKRIAGYARVLEWTYGDRGHHPHYHIVLLLRAPSEAEAVAAAEGLRDTYLRNLETAGRDGRSAAARQHAFQVQGAASVSRYITKWGLAEEMTGAQAKDEGGLTQWQLLRLSRTAVTEAERARYAAIWWEIIRSVSGCVQLYKSEGWRQLVSEWREKNPPELQPMPELMVGFGGRQRGAPVSELWVNAQTKTLLLREAGESHEDLDRAITAIWQVLDGDKTDSDVVRSLTEEAQVELVDVGDDEPINPEDLAAMPEGFDDPLPEKIADHNRKDDGQRHRRSCHLGKLSSEIAIKPAGKGAARAAISQQRLVVEKPPAGPLFFYL